MNVDRCNLLSLNVAPVVLWFPSGAAHFSVNTTTTTTTGIQICKFKKSQISKETDTVDEGIVFEISEAQTWKEQSSKSSVEFVVALFQVAKESPCPLRLLAGLVDLVTVGGVLANVPRWDAS